MNAQQIGWGLLIGLVLVVAYSRVSSAADPPAAAHAAVKAGGTLVDVRTAAEFASGHLPGAINVPVDELPRRYAEIGNPAKAVVVYCRSGVRSAAAATELKARGFTQVINLGGMGRW
jgi:rhodanese-related sulfurtransferase